MNNKECLVKFMITTSDSADSILSGSSQVISAGKKRDNLKPLNSAGTLERIDSSYPFKEVYSFIPNVYHYPSCLTSHIKV